MMKTVPPVITRGRTLLLYVLLFFIIWSLRATVFYSIDSGIASDTGRWIYSQAVKIAIWTIPVFIYLRASGRNDALTFLRLTTPVRRNALWLALGIGYLGGMLAFAHLVEGRTLAALWQADRTEILLVIARTSVSPLSEELLFRGFLLNAFRERMPFWQANLVTAVLFVLIHWPYHWWTRGFTLWLVNQSVGIFLLALLLGWLVKLSDSLWPAVAVHVANNVLVSFLRP